MRALAAPSCITLLVCTFCAYAVSCGAATKRNTKKQKFSVQTGGTTALPEAPPAQPHAVVRSVCDWIQQAVTSLYALQEW